MTLPESLRTLAHGLAEPRLSEAFREREFGREELGTSRAAAVLVLLSGDPEPELLLIERAGTLRKHAGQIAFPGGGIDPEDATPVAAALRETFEEVGLPPTVVQVLGQLPAARIPVSRFHVHAVVGWWDGSRPLVASVAEVASLHRVPVSRLADPANRSSWRHASGRVGPGFSIDDLYIWGFTAYVIDAVLEIGGWAVPWDTARLADIPARFASLRPV